MIKCDDWFGYVDNFKKIENIPSYCIFENRVKDAVVTIGIPTYKRSRTIIDAIDSSIGQNCSFRYDIIVLDNNPDRNDETEIVMNNYSNTPMVSYYKNKENLGMGGNWNRLFSLASTKWVVLLHDDDMIAPNFLHEMIRVAETYDADVVNSAFLLWYEGKEEKPTFLLDEKGVVTLLTLPMEFYGHIAGMPTGTLYKRDVYISEGGVNQDFFPSLDYVFHSKLSYKHRFLLFSKKLTLYRFSLNESMKKETKEKYLVVDYKFRIFVGKIIEYPSWFVNMFNDWVAEMRVKDLRGKKLLGRKYIGINNFIKKVLLHFIYKTALKYYFHKNYIGSV